MNEFKNKKLAEFDNNFVDWNRCSQINENKNVNDIKQFISDLIDEMEANLFLKDIVTKTRIDTLKKIMVSENKGNWTATDAYIIDKAKELWGIDLTNLN